MPSSALTIEVTLHVFSGRPDPKWGLSEAQIEELIGKLGELPSAQPRTPPGLGYRGIRITNLSDVPMVPARIVAYSGVLTITDKGTTSYYKDVAKIEQWLLHQGRGLGYGEIIDEALQFVRK